jgi:hypothetical protein
MSQVENPVSAAKQNNCTADDGGHDQDRHVNLQRFLSYATSVHSIRIGASMSAINMFASFSAVTEAFRSYIKITFHLLGGSTGLRELLLLLPP